MKVPDSTGRLCYTLLEKESSNYDSKYSRVLQDGFLSMEMAQNFLVVKTVAGMAMAVAAAIDAMHFPEVVGSIAGDDTIMMALRTSDDTKILIRKMKEVLSPVEPRQNAERGDYAGTDPRKESSVD
jgi:transcriptional regulator of arginine metabolism